MLSWLGKYVSISAVITYLGAAVSAFGAVWVFVLEGSQYEVWAVIMILFGALISAGGALWSSGERTKFERELRDRSDEIASLNREIAASVTGGESFCYLAMASLGVAETNTAILTIVQQGEYPLYDISVNIMDLQAFRRANEAGQIEQMGQYQTNLQVGNMSSGSAMPIANWQLPDTNEQDYNIFFNARNGFFTQFLRLRRVGGSWKSATKVRKEVIGVDEPSTLYEQVDSDFPLNDQGQVEWIE